MVVQRPVAVGGVGAAQAATFCRRRVGGGREGAALLEREPHVDHVGGAGGAEAVVRGGVLGGPLGDGVEVLARYLGQAVYGARRRRVVALGAQDLEDGRAQEGEVDLGWRVEPVSIIRCHGLRRSAAFLYEVGGVVVEGDVLMVLMGAWAWAWAD